MKCALFFVLVLIPLLSALELKAQTVNYNCDFDENLVSKIVFRQKNTPIDSHFYNTTNGEVILRNGEKRLINQFSNKCAAKDSEVRPLKLPPDCWFATTLGETRALCMCKSDGKHTSCHKSCVVEIDAGTPVLPNFSRIRGVTGEIAMEAIKKLSRPTYLFDVDCTKIPHGYHLVSDGPNDKDIMLPQNKGHGNRQGSEQGTEQGTEQE